MLSSSTTSGFPLPRKALPALKTASARAAMEFPAGYVIRCFSRRWDVLNRALPYCDEVIFYDNKNGFVKIAEYKNSRLTLFATPPPNWFWEFLETSTL